MGDHDEALPQGCGHSAAFASVPNPGVAGWVDLRDCRQRRGCCGERAGTGWRGPGGGADPGQL